MAQEKFSSEIFYVVREPLHHPNDFLAMISCIVRDNFIQLLQYVNPL